MLSQILRFTLPPSSAVSSTIFSRLRQDVAAAGATAQYYGYTAATKLLGFPRKRHEVCWVIQWPETACDRSAVMAKLADIAEDGDASSVMVKFNDSQLSELIKALESPISEFAVIRLKDNAPLADKALQTSMHKTYEDAYKLHGFTGGHWAYAINTNETHGVPCTATDDHVIPENERRLAVYYLGWESIEFHEDATKTPEFAEEIDKLTPYFGPGTGAWYAMFRKHE